MIELSKAQKELVIEYVEYCLKLSDIDIKPHYLSDLEDHLMRIQEAIREKREIELKLGIKS